MTPVVILMILLIILIIISYQIHDFSLRICYWLIISLVGITSLNIFLAMSYYKKLRNKKGIPGPKGPMGLTGPKGFEGKCTVSDKCGIENCRDKIKREAEFLFPKEVSEMDEPNLDDNRKREIQPLVNLIDQITDKCKKSKLKESDFMRKIRPRFEKLK